MGAESDYRWVRTEDMNKYPWEVAWLSYLPIPPTQEDWQKEELYIENNENIIIQLLKQIDGVKFLKNENCEYKFEIDEELANMLIDECRMLIIRLINLDHEDEEKDIGMRIAHLFYNEYYEWDGELAEELCRALRILKNIRRLLKEHDGWSLVVEMMW